MKLVPPVLPNKTEIFAVIFRYGIEKYASFKSSDAI